MPILENIIPRSNYSTKCLLLMWNRKIFFVLNIVHYAILNLSILNKIWSVKLNNTFIIRFSGVAWLKLFVFFLPKNQLDLEFFFQRKKSWGFLGSPKTSGCYVTDSICK